MILTIAIAVGSALLHYVLQRQAAARYEKCMREAIAATKAAEGAHVQASRAALAATEHAQVVRIALADLPKKRGKRTKAAGIGEPEQPA